MTDERKTKAQLIAELSALRKSNAKLKTTNEIRQQKIVDLQRAQKVQPDSGMTYQKLLDIVPVVIILSTPDGSIIDVSETSVRLAGYKSKRDFVKVGSNAHWYDSKERDGLMHLLKKGSVEGYQLYMRKKDGSVFWASINTVVHKSDGGNLLKSSVFFSSC